MELTYLKDLWNDAETAGMDEPELLRYRSNLLGRDLRLTNFGGGNTSAKLPGHDPVTGENVEVLWVKGSGGDLGTIKRDGFATLYMDRLNALKKQYRGVEFEDSMVDLYPLCTFGNNPRATSIDTPLHAYLPFKHVDHLHPDWAIALAACANGPAQLEKLKAETGIDLVWLPWKRPGFQLGLWLQEAYEANPQCDGIILGSHGLFTWGDTCRESYLSTLRVIDAIGRFVLKSQTEKGDKLFGGQIFEKRADQSQLAQALFPIIRGQVGPAIGHFEQGAAVQQFINSADAKALAYQGTSCPDHFVRTKVRPLYVEWDVRSGSEADAIKALHVALASYRDDYASYYEENRLPDSPAIRSKNPTVVLVPGVGMFSFGRNKAEARITGEFYINAINVMAGATSLEDEQSHSLDLLEPYLQKYTPDAKRPVVVNNYTAMALQESFNIEYWSLEEAKIQRMPPEKEMSRKVALVVGAGPGIGTLTAEQLAKNGAHVVVADIKPEMAQQSSEKIGKAFGKEISFGVTVDATNREAVRKGVGEAIMQFGGVDTLIVVAAVFIAPDVQGFNTDAQWLKTFEVNVLGSNILAEEAFKVIKAQGTEGSIVLVSSANAVVSKKGSLAYDTSKAAVNHLIREMAITFAPHVRVMGVAPATVVAGSQMFPRDRVISSLAKYDIAYSEAENDDELRDKLANFYAQRTLLKKPVDPVKVAEACYLAASPKLSLTTGQVIAVDAGLADAFLR